MNIYERWDEYAEKRNNYISGQPLAETLSFHQLEFPINKKVIVLGVGRSNEVKELSKSNTVYAVDVSKILLDEAKEQGASEIYMSYQLKEIEPVDLVLCNLVLQHNHADEITRLFNDINLTDTGIASFQFSTIDYDCTLTKVMVDDFNNGEQFFYSKERMEKIVLCTNKKIVKNDMPLIKWRNPYYQFNWNFVRLANK
jgi:trans-aconitate methyltransferase